MTTDKAITDDGFDHSAEVDIAISSDNEPNCSTDSDHHELPEDLAKNETHQDAKRLSKNQKRKLAKQERKIEYRLKRRLRDRETRKLRNKQKYEEDSEGVNNLPRKERVSQQKMEVNLRLRQAKGNAPKVCIDLSFDSCMSEKELSQLSDHIQRIHGSNKKAPTPLHVMLCNFSPRNPIYDTCLRKHHGFLNYIIDFHEKSLLEVFRLDQVVYLTPDSENLLETLDKDKVYVMGGLVDLSVKKNHTMEFATKHQIQTASLPILKYMQMDRTNMKHSFKRILSINQVFDILLKFYETDCWKTSLELGMPKRHGYLPSGDTQG